MNSVDIIILTTILGSTLLGIRSGLIRQAITLFGLFGGVIVAGRFYESVATFLHGSEGSGLVADANWARIIAFAGIVILFGVLLHIMGSVLRTVTTLLFLGWLDHLLGGLLGLIMAVTLVMSMLVVAAVFPVPGFSEGIRTSLIAQWLSGYVPVILSMLPPEFQQYYNIVKLGVPGIPGLPRLPISP